MMNMRRTLKQPTLRMNAGGDTSALGVMNRATATYQSMQTPDPAALAAKAMAAPAAPLTQGQFNQDRILAAGARTQTFQPTMQLAQQEPARISPMMLREGGDGGPVPGKGTGDKIPALYEPGEFVVSNDMLKAAPELRGQLHDLRGNVLAAQGKTPEEADVDALDYDGRSQGGEHGQARDGKTSSYKLESLGVQGRGGLRSDLQRGKVDGPHRVSLRALDGFEVNERPWTSADSRTFAKQPGPGNPNVSPAGSAEAAAFRAPPVATPASGVSLEPTASGLLRDKVFGSSADWAKTADTLTKERSFPGSGILSRVASKLAAPLAVGSGGYSAYQGASEGDVGKTALGVGDAVAGAALMTPAAPAAAGYLAARGAYEAPQVLRDAIGPRGLETIGGTINQIGRKTGLWGTDDSAYLSSKGAMSTPPPTTPAAPATTQPNGAGTNQAAYDKANADVSAAMQKPSLRTANVSVTRQPNGTPMFSGTNVSGPVTYDGDAAKSLRSPGSTFSVMPGMSQALIDKTLTNSDGSRWTAQDEATARANLRDGVDVNRGTSQGRATEAARIPGIGEFGHNKAVAAQLAREQNITQRRGQDITSADGRYGHELTSQSNRARLRQEQFVSDRSYNRDVANDNFTQGAAAQKNITEQFSSMLPPGEDGKPDLATTGRYLTGLNAVVAQRKSLLKQHLQLKPDDATAKRELADITDRNVAALGNDAIHKHFAGMQLADLASATATGALTPWGTRAVVSNAPVTRLTKLPSGEYQTDRGTKENPEIIPARYIDKVGGVLGIGGKKNMNFESLKE